MDVFDFLELSTQSTEPIGEIQMRTVERESVSMALRLSPQRPLDQCVRTDDGHELQCLGRQHGLFDSRLYRFDQLGFAVDLGLEVFGSASQRRTDAMFAEPCADRVIFSAEEILSEVAQEMEMTDEVGHVGKHVGDGLEDPLAHVVDQRDRGAEVRLYALQERCDMRLVLSGQLHVAQNDLRKGVDRAHQQRVAALASGVEVADVSTAALHMRGHVGSAPPMGNGQVDDEFHPQQ